MLHHVFKYTEETILHVKDSAKEENQIFSLRVYTTGGWKQWYCANRWGETEREREKEI